ncbi:MAG: Fic family protein [Candidatus Berkelbacteria bacterium]|nr:Fic family protein [Candidatus Berkelbacteria bacterium]
MYTPKFTITNKILKNIGIIEASREVIDNAPLLPYYEKKFRDEALVRTVHYGTHIEGNELNISQAEKVLAGQDVVARERDIQEVINYRKAMDFIGGIRSESSELSIKENLIKKLHQLTIEKILEGEKCGEYRKSKVVVKNSKTGEVSFTPPSSEEVEPLIGDFLAYIDSIDAQDLHPVLRSGIVHYEIVRIHPFVDGNGRVARALSTLVLFINGYDIRKFFSLEEYFDHDAIRYYQALQSVEKNSGDLTNWLEYFTEGLAIELSKIKERVEKISIDGKLREKLGGKPLMLTDRQLKIIEYIQEVGFLQNQVFKTLFPMVSEDTILNELKPLVENGIIKKTGVTKGAKYVMDTEL